MDIAVTWMLGLVACVAIIFIHHLVLLAIGSRLLPRFQEPHPRYVVAIVLILFATHVVESQVFGVVLYVAATSLELGTLAGSTGEGLIDYLYFSLVSYTSLGFGDILPTGHLRLLSGLEALLGLLLIGWSASFLFARVEDMRS